MRSQGRLRQSVASGGSGSRARRALEEEAADWSVGQLLAHLLAPGGKARRLSSLKHVVSLLRREEPRLLTSETRALLGFSDHELFCW